MKTALAAPARPVAVPLATILATLLAAPVLAQGVATERELSPVEVHAGSESGARAPLDPTLPSSTHSTTREAFESQSFINAEDALTYAPNTYVRKRFIGDRNANLSGRSFGTLQPARGLAYVDGYLISNFLGRFDAPRWNIVSPEEVDRVDVLYGPFSAIYPGNSIGTTVAITTRVPQALEASGRLQAYRQTHGDYGLKRDYGGNQQSLFAGNRWGDLGLAISANRLAYRSQPMAYATAARSTLPAGGEPVVRGARFDRDPTGADRVVLGATGIQKGVQDQAKIKLAYDLSPQLQADVLYAHWRNDYRVSNESLLRDAAGREVWRAPSGATHVNIDGFRYALPSMTPEKGEEEHRQWGGRLRTLRPEGWNHSVQLSGYHMLEDSNRQASVSDPFAGEALAGRDTRRDGTGWRTFELQSTYTPAGRAGHALTFGYHQNDYELRNRVFGLADWRRAGSRMAETQNFLGKTQVRAVYAQDAWTFHPDWIVTAGLRVERFRAYDGSQFVAGATPARIDYADRRASGLSPKLSLSYLVSDEWVLRASYGRGVRFPTVSELFQGTVASFGGTPTIVRNDPRLAPEESDALELSAIRELGASSLRLTVFQDDIRDAIFQQSQLVGASTVVTVQNVERVRTRGVEIAWQATNVLVRGFGLQTSLAWNEPKTISNPALPASEGKYFPRIPRVRASALASYATGPWLGSLGVRHSGRQYNTLDNSDTHSDTFGAVSSFTVVDAKLAYRFDRRASLAIGVDNLTDERYYVFHPYPARTAYAELSVSY